MSMMMIVMMITMMIMMAMAMSLVVMMLTFMKVATRMVVTVKGGGPRPGQEIDGSEGQVRAPQTAEQQPRRCQEQKRRRRAALTSGVPPGKKTATKHMCLDTTRHSSRVRPMIK